MSLLSSQVETVAIIGGGASGSIALDSLVQEKHFKSITLFERRSSLGGIWNLDANSTEDPSAVQPGYTSDQIDPQLPNPFHSADAKNKRFILAPRSKQERFADTPSYKGIKTNIIEEIMTFSDIKRWGSIDVPHQPEKTRYVDGLVVKDYIESYIKRNENRDNVSVIKGTTVEDVEEIKREPVTEGEIPLRYRLTLRQVVNEEFEIWWQEVYDAVIVATGHYFVPYIPSVKGLAQLQRSKPGVVQHSKYYRSSEPYRDETVIVVGSRASGADVAKYVADTATQVYQSIRNLANTKTLTKKPNVATKGVISEFVVAEPTADGVVNFTVKFEDGSEVQNPDHIIYATGYQFSFPFLNKLTENRGLIQEGKVISGLYQHTFLVDHPLITFIGMPIDGVSFRVFEFQAVLVARYLSGKVRLPSAQQQRQWCQERLDNKGVSRSYHTIGFVDAPSFLGALTKLGEVESPTGRPFPVLTDEDLQAYKSWAEKLVANWDLR
ncbi:FAD/NAD(P)-binding domain-containing protein [[Candida] zeylanoides]